MSVARRRFDPTGLPAFARYALALLVVVAVVWLVVRLTDAAEPADWYPIVVTVGATLLLVLVVATIVRTVLRWLRR